MEKHSQEIPIHTDYIKLEQLLKLAGITGTGGEAKERIAAGECEVNGEACLMRGKKLRPGDRVSVGGETFTVTRGGSEVRVEAL